MKVKFKIISTSLLLCSAIALWGLAFKVIDNIVGPPNYSFTIYVFMAIFVIAFVVMTNFDEPIFDFVDWLLTISIMSITSSTCLLVIVGIIKLFVWWLA
ncbi:hypothetical protein [Lactiplantibacillus daowaiensis]|uniref:Integral membrane protein n=1 Tax=Lactiplantibacillus daowaiensis TaxID=2559918 RepID=A0ABW1RYR1_9LACO|nr:hypothetical protein [Lactiplantibacillus daowaiensis]